MRPVKVERLDYLAASVAMDYMWGYKHRYKMLGESLPITQLYNWLENIIPECVINTIPLNWDQTYPAKFNKYSKR